MKSLMLALVAALFIFQTAHAANVEVIDPKLWAGETLVVKFDEMPQSASFLGKSVPVFPYREGWRAAFPVPLATKAGSYNFTADFGSGAHFEKTVLVKSGAPRTIVLPVPPKLGLTAKEVTQTLASVNSAIRKTVEKTSDVTRFTTPFGLPLRDNRKITSSFGEVRKTGEERITHLGTDFEMPKGSAVAAINAGIVSDAYVDPIYGNSVIIDHGRGIYSLYLHLDSMKVKKGDPVKKGTLVGTLGESGLASAPHLHLSIKINGVSVDPVQFISTFR